MRCIGLAFMPTLALLAVPLAGEAQPAGKVYRIGFIFTTSPVSEMAGPESAHLKGAEILVHAAA